MQLKSSDKYHSPRILTFSLVRKDAVSSISLPVTPSHSLSCVWMATSNRSPGVLISWIFLLLLLLTILVSSYCDINRDTDGDGLRQTPEYKTSLQIIKQIRFTEITLMILMMTMGGNHLEVFQVKYASSMAIMYKRQNFIFLKSYTEVSGRNQGREGE